MKEKSTDLVRRQLLRVGATAAAITSAPAIVRAQQTTTLTFSSWLPKASLVAENLFIPWAQEIREITSGRVELQFLPESLGPPPKHLELVQSGDVDIAYSIHGYSSGLFNRARIGQFSFLGDAYGASHAFSRVYGQLLKAEQEHKNMELLGLFQHGPGVLLLKDKVIRKLDDYKGLRIRTAGGYIGDLLTDLGAQNMPMSPTAVRQALIDGEIDGVAFPYEAGPAFDLLDHITFVSELPNGYYNATWFLGMSMNAASRLSPDDLVLIKKYSANTVHVLAAKAFDYADYLGKEAFQSAGITIEQTTEEITAHIRSIANVYEKKWSEQLAKNDFDGERALAYTRRITNGG